MSNKDSVKKGLNSFEEIKDQISEQLPGINFLSENKIGLLENQKSGDTRKLIRRWLEISQRSILYAQNPKNLEKNLERIKSFFHKKYVPTLQTFPIEEYTRVQLNEAEQLGFGRNQSITEEQVKLEIENIKQTLDPWIEYFTSIDSSFLPVWAKYWAFMGVLKMSGIEKINPLTNEISFPKREKETFGRFPELNREALANAVDHIRRKVEKNENLNENLQNESFRDVYTFYLNKLRAETTIQELEITNGYWIKYNQGSDEDEINRLVDSLYGKNTGWCTATKSTAENQLYYGDFYVYYTESNKTSKPNPRIAIRMEEEKIAEIRGIAFQQNLDEIIAGTNILDEKLLEFEEEGLEYKLKSENMKKLTKIYKNLQTNSNYEVTAEEEDFIRSNPIGFGYEQDPRIYEILSYLELRRKYNFTILEESEILKLLEANEDRGILDALPFINQRFHNLIVDKLIHDGKSKEAVQNLHKFKGLNHIQIAKELIEKGLSIDVVANIAQFNKLDRDICISLINLGFVYTVSCYLDKFDKLDKEIAEKLIDGGNCEKIILNLDKFTELSKSSALKLIDKGYYIDIVSNIEKFTDIDVTQIANKVIEDGFSRKLAENLEKFKGLNLEETANKIIEANFGYIVSEFINKFVGVNQVDLAVKIIKSGYKSSVIENLYKFDSLNQLEIAVHLINTNPPWSISYNLSKFKGVTQQEIASKLIEIGKGYVVLQNLEMYKEIDMKAFADKLIYTKRGTTLLAFLEKFKDLDHKEIATKLIDTGQAETVIRFLDKFKNLDKSIEDKLIKSGFITIEALRKNYSNSFISLN